ncbi:MAG TPA: precorrin-3B C(17)-methyltransferase [Gammaproteobacteria bacterium]|nr:precorrin-3B C(17)-methyltransferase [Gammaproteobacteria bacterium]
MSSNSKKGKIFLVGFGPGSADTMTYGARAAIEESDVVIGYSTYIKLVKDLLDGKEVVRKGMTEEIDRCIEAYDQAKLGKTVALISSGDIGVYGMAGPTYEVLLKSGWTPESDIKVEIIPGATALSACASLVGAPLTHDFCSISLSDLLTPWPNIAKRIDAAGNSDFVIALYNPKSGRRTQQIVEAQRILLQYRKPETPVAIVKSAYRDLQDIQITTLDKMSTHKIGMLSTVLIGNSTTFMREGLMITPRGYANKYDDITGETKDGEKAGRSLNMGLVGWKAVVREFMNTETHHSLRDVARHFDAPMEQIIEAIAEQNDDEPANGYHAIAVPAEKMMAALKSSEQFGKLRCVVRAEGGAVSEMMINSEDFEQRGDWLNIENDFFHCHINWNKVSSAWFVHHCEKLMGLQFFDCQGHTVFNLSVIKQDGKFKANVIEKYEQAINDVTTIEKERAVNE